MSPISYTPRPYQALATSWLLDKPKAALFLDVGLGKSSVALTHMAYTLAVGDVKRWLIVAPLRVCQTTWPSELEKWAFAQHLTVYHLYGPLGKKRTAMSNESLKADITIINVENIAKLAMHFRPLWPWDGVVIDESSKFKDSTTNRWKAMRHVTKHITHLMELTGSPCAQSLMNLWAQVYLIDRGERLGRTKDAFKYRYFRQVDYLGYDWQPVEGALEQILEQIKDVCLVIQAKGMPEPVYNTLDVMLDFKSLKQYKELEKESFLELDEDEGVTALSAAALTNKLSQLANGFAYWETEVGDKQVYDLHKYKVEAVEDFADEHQGAFILGYHYKQDKERIAKALGKRVEFFDATKDQLERWGRGDFQILALHPQSGGHGVDGLQHYTCTVLWYAPPWSREQFDQLNGRVTGARQVGTQFEHTQSVVNILQSRGTVDEVAHEVLFTRGEEQSTFLKLLRERGARLLHSLP